jgi:hypothetical protein
MFLVGVTMDSIKYFSVLFIVIGYVITLAVTVFYGVIASWYKNPAGRYIFILLLSITLVLTNSVLRIIFPGQIWLAISGLILFGLYMLSICALGVGIYNAQIRSRYLHKLRDGKPGVDILEQTRKEE